MWFLYGFFWWFIIFNVEIQRFNSYAVGIAIVRPDDFEINFVWNGHIESVENISESVRIKKYPWTSWGHDWKIIWEVRRSRLNNSSPWTKLVPTWEKIPQNLKYEFKSENITVVSHIVKLPSLTSSDSWDRPFFLED